MSEPRSNNTTEPTTPATPEPTVTTPDVPMSAVDALSTPLPTRASRTRPGATWFRGLLRLVRRRGTDTSS
ncbi:MAG TPA: hypothetical protein VFH76_11385 [Kribbella sp.]|nr:hypothetical protein [Kribbella sp.]